MTTDYSLVSTDTEHHSLTSHSMMRLPRSLSVIETWGFGLTTPIGWLNVAVPMHEALGTQAMLVWLPGVIISMLLNIPDFSRDVEKEAGFAIIYCKPSVIISCS